MTDDVLSPQQEFEVQRRLQFGAFAQAYTALVSSIDKSFLNPQQNALVRKEFDDGYLWAKEYFLTAQCPVAPEAPKADATDNSSEPDAA